MKYAEEDLRKDLEKVKTGNDMNGIRKKCIESGVKWEKISADTKKLYAETQARIHPCPDEHRENPHIHYEVPHFCRDNQ